MIAPDLPPALAQPEPPAFIEEARRRRRRGSARGTGPAIAVGTVLLLSDGTPCRVTHFDQTGRPWCIPLDQ